MMREISSPTNLLSSSLCCSTSGIMLPRKPSFSAASSRTAIIRCDCSGPSARASSLVVIRALINGVVVGTDSRTFRLTILSAISDLTDFHKHRVRRRGLLPDITAVLFLSQVGTRSITSNTHRGLVATRFDETVTNMQLEHPPRRPPELMRSLVFVPPNIVPRDRMTKPSRTYQPTPPGGGERQRNHA